MSQTEKLYQVLLDGRPHRVDEILDKVYGNCEGFSVSRIGARVFDLKRRYGVEIKSWPDHSNRKLWCYQIVKEYEKQAVQKKGLTLDEKAAIARQTVHVVRPEPKREPDLFGFAA